MALEGEPNVTFSPENVANSESVFDIKLSPNAKQLLYHVKPLYKSGDHETCAIWLGDVGSADSAKQFTAGLFNDHSARFHPDGKRIIFLSDRHKPGGQAQPYSISLSGGEASPLYGKENKKAVSGFEISPDGRYIAFPSPDEPTAEDERREREKDDANDFDDKRDFNRLRLYSFVTGEVRTLGAGRDGHTYQFTWASDSKSLYFLTRSHSALESGAKKTDLQRISTIVGALPEIIGSYPQAPSGICVLSSEDIIDIQSYEPTRVSDSKSIFIHTAGDFRNTIRRFGDVDDAVSILNLRNECLAAVEVAKGLQTRIMVIDPKFWDKFVLYETHEDDIGRSSWDVRKREDGTFVLAVVKSSAVRQESPNVWTGTLNNREGPCVLDTRISSHLQWMGKVPAAITEEFNWSAKDGTELDGTIVWPPQNEGAPSLRPLPTVMIVHGGPYSRITLGYTPSYNSWPFLLAAQGFLVISPNYRGGLGHGSDFARAAHGGMGTLDWSDCESMLDKVVDLGFADPSRLGIGGWSQGGFMTAWGVATTKNRFKAGVMGAGVSDWGTLTLSSDLPDFEADLGGCAPWDTANPNQRLDVHGSPIGHVEGVETAVLILHGEKDERVPVSQGIGFFRGLRRRAKNPERAQLVIYPREPHGFAEKKHAEHVMKRVVEHFISWL